MVTLDHNLHAEADAVIMIKRVPFSQQFAGCGLWHLRATVWLTCCILAGRWASATPAACNSTCQSQQAVAMNQLSVSLGGPGGNITGCGFYT